MDYDPKQNEINWTIFKMFGGAERAAKLTMKQIDDGWLAISIDCWKDLAPWGGAHFIDRLAALGFKVDIERLWDGASYSHWHHRTSGTVKTNYTRWSVNIEFQGGNRHGDVPAGAPDDSFFGTGDTLTAALQAALLDLDTEWAKGRSIKAALEGEPKVAATQEARK